MENWVDAALYVCLSYNILREQWRIWRTGEHGILATWVACDVCAAEKWKLELCRAHTLFVHIVQSVATEITIPYFNILSMSPAYISTILS